MSFGDGHVEPLKGDEMLGPAGEYQVTFEMAMAAVCELQISVAELELAVYSGIDRESTDAGDATRERLMNAIVDQVGAELESSLCVTMSTSLFDIVAAQLLRGSNSPIVLAHSQGFARSVLH